MTELLIDTPITLTSEKFPDEPIATTLDQAFIKADFRKGSLIPSAIDALTEKIGRDFDDSLWEDIHKQMSERHPERNYEIVDALVYYQKLVSSRRLRE